MRKASEAVRLQRLFPYLRNSIASVKVTASLPIAALPPFPKPGRLLCHFSSQRDVQSHHQTESHAERYGAHIGMPSLPSKLYSPK